MKKIFVLVLSVLMLTGLYTKPVYADVGPKPSVTIYIDDVCEGSCYVSLLSDREPYGPWQRDSAKKNIPMNADDEYKAVLDRVFDYQDQDGFIFIGNLSEDLKGKDSFAWTYYPPDTFKVIVYDALKDVFYTSAAVSRAAFNSYFRVHLENGQLQIEEEIHIGKDLLRGLFRAAVTIIAEMALAYLFGFREKKELLAVLIVNLITQILLNLVLAVSDYFGGMLVWMFMFVIGEAAVVVVEMIIYLFALKKQKKGKIVFYALLANLLSAMFTFIGTAAVWAR